MARIGFMGVRQNIILLHVLQKWIVKTSALFQRNVILLYTQ